MPGTSSLSCAQGGLRHAKLQRILAGFAFGCLPLLAVLGGAGVLLTCTGSGQGVTQTAALEDALLERKTSLWLFFASPFSSQEAFVLFARRVVLFGVFQ